MDFTDGLFLGFVIGIIIGAAIGGGSYYFNLNRAVATNGNVELRDLSNSQIIGINNYLKTNYPDNIAQNSNEKTTIIYVYQNGTQPVPAGGFKI